jgi:hypothetical protein
VRLSWDLLSGVRSHPTGNLAEYPFKKVPMWFQERGDCSHVFSLGNNDGRSDMKKFSCVLAALRRLPSRARRVSASASAATEIITIATVMTTIAALALGSTNMIAGCVAAGTITMATEQ